MGKRMKTKSRNPRKIHQRSQAGSAQAVSEPSDSKGEVGDEQVKDREQCNHYTMDTSQLSRVLLGVLSLKDGIACEHCREGPISRRGNKEKGKQHKKKGGAKPSEEKLEPHHVWVCLDCGHYFCGGGVNDSVPYGHARRHAKQDRHCWAVRFDDLSITWCFSCNSEVPIEIPEWISDGEARSTVDDKAAEHGHEPLAVDSVNSYVIRGLSNLGNTCFFNSILQNLLSIDMLREYMVSLDRSIGPLTMALKKFFLETSGADDSKGVLSPKNLFGSICSKAPQFRGYQQQDSHELLRCLLDGLSMEEITARKLENSSSEQEKSTSSSAATMMDSIFGGQLSSTVSCVDCGHTSVVHEPFLDLSLPVPSKKPPSKKVPPLPKRNKPSTRDKNRSRRIREKASPRESPVTDQSPAECSESIIPDSEADKIIEKREEPSESSESFASVTNPGENDTCNRENAFWWLDYLEPTAQPGFVNTESQICGDSIDGGQVHQNEYNLHGTAESPVGNCSKNDVQVTSESQIDNCPKEQVVSSDSCGENFIGDTVPSYVQDSAVILLPYKELDAPSEGIDGTASSSQNPQDMLPTGASVRESSMETASELGAEKAEVDFDGFGDLFNEPEVTSESKTESGLGEEMDVMFWNSSGTELNQDEVDNSNTPVSIDSCLALFTKPELLTDEHAWHCEHCSEVLSGHCLEQREACGQDIASSENSESVKSLLDENEVPNASSSLHVEVANSSEMKVLGHGKMTTTCTNIDVHAEMTSGLNAEGKFPQIPLVQIGQSESKRLKSGEAGEEKNELLNPALSKRPSSSDIKHEEVISSNKECSGRKENISCSIDDPQDAGCGEEASSNCLPNCKELRLSSAHENDNVDAVNQEGKGRSRLLDKTCSRQDNRNKDDKYGRRKIMRDAMKRFLISKAPPILTIHLKRFSQDARGRLTKLKGHVNFQEMLDIRPFVDPRCREKEKYTYRLIGVVEHSGSMGGGHYVAYVRGERIRGRAQKAISSPSWFYASDSHVREVSLSEVLKSEAYILFYERVQG
ncbi:ubiquitin carboxyl-terminal hydrolase 2-like [Typha latifolia]|uniref:ubiquitin carboxyl-terminal hydrolase 2-like n=1 Tax=Typha latifolia TaxID=4733 RepID=UPI003C2DB340